MEDRDSSPMERLAKWVFKDKIEIQKEPYDIQTETEEDIDGKE